MSTIERVTTTLAPYSKILDSFDTDTMTFRIHRHSYGLAFLRQLQKALHNQGIDTIAYLAHGGADHWTVKINTLENCLAD